MQEHNKFYVDDLEEWKRYNIWQANKEMVEEHNKNANKLGYTLSINKFADLETRELVTGLRRPSIEEECEFFQPQSNFQPAANVNWTARGAVTPVGNQLQCGSCWAFSATGALEGQHFIETGKLISLSEQNLMDCTANAKYNNYACNGGYMTSSFQYVKDNGGIDTEASYPYISKSNSKCLYNTANIGATCAGYKKIPSKDEEALMQAVQNVGPVSVAVDALQPSFSMYKSGIYYEPKCSRTNVNHTPLAVGFGTLNGTDYWLLKNSWGTDWGMDGYMIMARNKNNMCGIATLASYPTV